MHKLLNSFFAKKRVITIVTTLLILAVTFIIFLMLRINELELKLSESKLLKTISTPIPTPDIYPLETKYFSINKWYLIAESKQFKIYYSGSVDGDITTVVDKYTGNLYIPDKSCETKIPEETISKQNFYNSTVGIINHGPYKTIKTNSYNTNTFLQSYESGGCRAQEGTINMEVEDPKLVCNIDIKYTPLGCL